MKLAIVALLSISSSLVLGAPKTAQATASSRSVYQDPISWFVQGVGALTTFISTHDGVPGLPLFDDVSQTFSGELRPRPAQPLVFDADYLTVNRFVEITGWGTLEIALGNSGDSDGNSIPDVFQFDKAGTVSFTGFIRPESVVTAPTTITGTITKSANQPTAQNTFSTRGADGSIVTFLGGMQLGIFRGTAVYSREPGQQNQLQVTLAGAFGNNTPSTYVGITTFTVVNQDQISVPAFNARRADGFQLQVQAFTLARNGSRYTADLDVIDGALFTNWRDYTKWLLQIDDTNDADTDGVPDFSDALPLIPPTIAISLPADNRVFAAGSSVTLESIAVDSDGTVTRVEYFEGESSLGFATAPPFRVVRAFSPGVHRIEAVATDNSGATSRSPAVTLTLAARASLAIIRADAANVHVTGGGTEGVRYTLQSATFPAGPWEIAASRVAGARGSLLFENVRIDNPVKYYRLVAE